MVKPKSVEWYAIGILLIALLTFLIVRYDACGVRTQIERLAASQQKGVVR